MVCSRGRRPREPSVLAHRPFFDTIFLDTFLLCPSPKPPPATTMMLSCLGPTTVAEASLSSHRPCTHEKSSASHALL